MKVVIDISEEEYSLIKKCLELGGNHAYRLIANGTVLPEGHGDLIDREEFLKTFLDSFWGAVKEGNSSFEVVGVVKNIIRNAPTVIEADKENEND